MLAISIDLASEVPVYRQIAEELRGLMARGLLAEGAELPSVRDLGARIGTNQNTVAKAYRALADEGLLDLRHGARARVRLGGAPYREAREEAERRVLEAISRLVLAGAERDEVRQVLLLALDRFYEERNG